MKHEEKKAEIKKTESPTSKAIPYGEAAKVVTPAPAKTETPKADSGDLRSVVSKEEQPPVSKKAASSGKNTWAQLWQNASGKKGDPNEKDSKGSPVLEKYYRHWMNAD